MIVMTSPVRPSSKWAAAVRCWLLCGAVGLTAIAGCDDGDTAPGSRTCGDDFCDQNRCESPVRCPLDCGACVGPNCTPGGASGTCSEPCATSCDCVNAGEFCTADYGYATGVCEPVGCLDCLGNCQYTPNATGVCTTVTCPPR